jgi:hypothetical protein
MAGFLPITKFEITDEYKFTRTNFILCFGDSRKLPCPSLGRVTLEGIKKELREGDENHNH